MTERYYGFKRQLPDFRDFMFVPKFIGVLPPVIDLRSKMPHVYDQGALGSCTGNGIGAAFEYSHIKQGLKDFIPSRLFIYYNDRAMEGTINQDAGASIRDGIKSVAKQGVCSEVDWPYVISKFAKKPSVKCYKDALASTITQYAAVPQDIDIMKDCLAKGIPIVFGFSVYSSFESNQVTHTGVVPMPGQNESLLGGHCVVCVGYIDSVQRFICRNSWGTEWGENGYFSIPYAYLTNANLACDFWIIETVN